MNHIYLILFFSLLKLSIFAQGPEYDEWYTLYDDNGLKVKVNIFVAENKDVCINDKHISINYQYEGNPLSSPLYQEWKMPILSCNNQLFMVEMSVPLGPELKYAGEEGQEISAEQFETGEYLSGVKHYFNIPKPSKTNTVFNQKVLRVTRICD